MRKLSVYSFASLVAIILLFAGCKEDTKLKKNSIKLDTSKKQSATVTDSEGASFIIDSGGTTAIVIAMPGVFPAGTSISITPLSENKGLKGEKLSTFFDLKAVSGRKNIQPSMPVFLTIVVDSDLPESACLVAYNDGESIGYKVKSQIIQENGISYVTAELNHFTILGIGDDGEGIFVIPNEEDPPDTGGDQGDTKNNGEWKEWRFEANGPAKNFNMVKDNEAWDFEASMQLTAINTGGYIGGFYSGNPVITITAKAKKEYIPKNEANIEFFGDINLELSGNTEFLITLFPRKGSDVTTELLPDDPRVDVGQYLSGYGTFQLQGDSFLDISLQGQNVAPDAKYQDKTRQSKTYDCSIVISAKSTFIEIPGIGLWDAVMVGVPKGGLSAASSNEKETSPDTDILAGNEPQQTGGMYGLTREGWPVGDISDEIPEYTRGDVVNSGGDEIEFTILVDNTNEDDFNQYLQTLADNGWFTSTDFAKKKNITLFFQFNAKNLLQISVYSQKLGTWPADKMPTEIIPPEKGILIGDVEIIDYSGENTVYGISFEYSGLSDDDVKQYMESYLRRGWEGDQYYINKTIKWKGKNYNASIEPMFEEGNVFFNCNLIAVE